MKEKGTVKFFNDAKGFGFITGSNGKDYFIHSSSLNGSVLSEGTKVEFEGRQGQKGLEAINVVVIS
jgi:cold shock protein